MVSAGHGAPRRGRTGYGHRLHRRAVLAACGGFVAILIATGCGDQGGADSAGSTTPDVATAPDVTTDPTTGDTSAGPSDSVDACSLLTNEDVSQVLGGPVVGAGPTFGPGESLCAWEIEGDWSVTVSVGTPGTAPGNQFDPETALYLGIADPVGSFEGAYYVGLGIVAFAVDERVNTIQVVSPAGEEASRSGAETLAPVVAQRLAAATS